MSELTAGWQREKGKSKWRPASVGQLAEVIFDGPFGSNLKSDDYVSEGARVVRLENIGHLHFISEKQTYIKLGKYEQLKRHTLNAEDILFSSFVDEEVRVCLFPGDHDGPAINKADCFCIRVDRSLCDPNWLAYRLASKSTYDELREQVHGATRPRINLSVLKSLQVELPPLPEQRRIVGKIESLSGKSKRARDHLDHVPRLVEKYKQAVLAAAFKGELTREWRNGLERPSTIEHAAQLIARTAAPEQSRGGREATTSVKAGVGGISVNNPGTEPPDGWTWVSLRRIARQETGHTPSRSHPDYWDGGVPWIGIRDAGNHHGQVIKETLQTISDKGLANSSARLLPEGTVCLSRTASVGYVTIMGRSMATSQDFATWTCSEALLPKYLMYALMAEGNSIREFGEGSTHTTIYFPEIRAFYICLAPLIEQQEIVRRVEVALRWIDRLAIEATSARKLVERLDQAILAKAFRGELVPQNPYDEPATVLLDRIRAERVTGAGKAQT